MRLMPNYHLLFWFAGTPRKFSNLFLAIVADRLFLSVGAILKHFEGMFKKLDFIKKNLTLFLLFIHNIN